MTRCSLRSFLSTPPPGSGKRWPRRARWLDWTGRAGLAEFDFLGTLGELHSNDVRFVLIGGLAARLHGSPTVTMDTDICPAPDETNLTALAATLKNMNARLRGVDEPVPFVFDATTLANADVFTFLTDLGALDVLLRPAGTDGYDDLDSNAAVFEIEGVPTKVAALDDLIRMKEAAGRPKDRIELEILGALRDHQEPGH